MEFSKDLVWLSCRQLCVVSGETAKVEKYSSVGLDGAMVIWEFKVICQILPQNKNEAVMY